MVVILVVVPAAERFFLVQECLETYVGGETQDVTGNNVAADDLPPQSSQRLGHHGDDAATGGLDVGGASTGRGDSGADVGTNGWPCVRCLRS